MISQCAVTFTCTLLYIRTLRTMAVRICILPCCIALLWLRGEATALKLKNKASLKRLSLLLIGFGKWRSSHVDSEVQTISAGVEALSLSEEQRSTLPIYQKSRYQRHRSWPQYIGRRLKHSRIILRELYALIKRMREQCIPDPFLGTRLATKSVTILNLCSGWQRKSFWSTATL